MNTYKEAHHRSLLKALSWRFLATLATMSIVFAFTRKLALSAGVGFVEVIIKLILYYLHERIWSLVGIGRKEHPLSSLPVERALKDKDMQEVQTKLEELGYINRT